MLRMLSINNNVDYYMLSTSFNYHIMLQKKGKNLPFFLNKYLFRFSVSLLFFNMVQEEKLVGSVLNSILVLP